MICWIHSSVSVSDAIFLCKGLNYRDTHCLTCSIYLRASPILFLQPVERFQALLFYDFTHPLPLYISPYLCHQAAVFRLYIALAGALACSNPDCNHSRHYSLGAS